VKKKSEKIEQVITHGIDPGVTSGIATFVGDDLVGVQHIRVDHTDLGARLNALNEHRAICGLSDGSCPVSPTETPQNCSEALVCESQYLDIDASKKRGQRLSAIAGPLQSAVVWEAAARYLGIELLERVSPPTWRATFRLPHTRLAAKKAAIAVVQSKWPRVEDIHPGKLCDHCAEAVLITAHAHIHRLASLKLPIPKSFGRFETVLRKRRRKKTR